MLAAMWCFLGNHPFNMYELASGKKFIEALNPAYKAPTRKTIAGSLLTSVYTMTKSRTNDIIAAMDLINVITDESSNISGSRICNISVHSPSGSLHYISEDIYAKQMTAPAAAQWLRNHLLELSNGDLSRINSIITDTCALMFSMWVEMQRFIEFKHCLFIPCDSHGIQLLVKDLLQIPLFQDTLHKAQTIVKAFRCSLLQYARLRKFQLHYGDKRYKSLILSVITRWGTQFWLIQSVLNSKDALKRYAHDFGDLAPKKRVNQASIDILRDPQFWRSLEPLRELLLPLDESLRMSESGSSHLGHVLRRWMSIAEHLEMRKLDYPEVLTPFMSVDNDTGFAARFKRQVMPVHVAAYYLLPETRSKSIPENFDCQLQGFFRQCTSSEADFETLCYEFESFRAQVSLFEYGRRCWTLSKSPKLFWHSAMGHTELLGKLGNRLFSTQCNSVASERAFSIQNLIHTKSRNRLKSETTNKLAYVYTNSRILDRFQGMFKLPDSIKTKSIHKLTSEDEVELENILLGIDLDDENIEMDYDENDTENEDEDVDGDEVEDEDD